MKLKEFVKSTTPGDYIINIDGFVLNCSIYDTGCNIECHIWNESGSSIIYEWKDELPISYRKLCQLINWKKNGIPFCNSCLKKTTGRLRGYFAGAYCDKCWKHEYDGETYE